MTGEKKRVAVKKTRDELSEEEAALFFRSELDVIASFNHRWSFLSNDTARPLIAPPPTTLIAML